MGLPGIVVGGQEVRERYADADVQRTNMMPPPDRNEQRLTRFELYLHGGGVSKKRITIVVRRFAVHLAINADMVIDKVCFERRY